MKLVIQIPALDEEESLPGTLQSLPRQVAGFDRVEVLVVDDGSSDRTAEMARRHGADQVLVLPRHFGLARAFAAGLEAALARGADVVVNTDADQQYCSDDIPLLTAPILGGQADIVIGARPIREIESFSFTKRLLHRIGTWVVARLGRVEIRDAPSGFRAMSREAALQLNVFTSYTYTLETILQAGLSDIRIIDVPIRVNPVTRPSRLMRHSAEYVWRSVGSIVSVVLIYRPTLLFGLLSAGFLVPGAALAVRYLYFVGQGEGRGHVQSVIVAAALGVVGALFLAIGVVAHLLGINRRLLEVLLASRRARQVEDANDESPGTDTHTQG